MSLRHPCRLILFDLDGTLIDSTLDIARAVNAALARMGYPAISVPEIIRFVGDGVEVLLHRVLREIQGGEPDRGELQTAASLMVSEYSAHLADATVLYPRVRETLGELSWAGFGLVSNKPEVLSRRLLEYFHLLERFCAVFGGDSLPRRKPDPAPLIAAMGICGAAPDQTVMVGDSRNDILAGKAAGVFTCGLTTGFGTRQELQAAGCDILLDDFHDLLSYLIPA